MPGWRCFVITPSLFCRRILRRYRSAQCSKTGWIHDAQVVIDARFEAPREAEGGFPRGQFEGDPRWPAVCACGYGFRPDDEWQVNVMRLYQGAPEGKLYALRDPDLPVGAMWDADWMPWKGPDGRAWTVRLPGGAEWPIDMPESQSGGRWQRTGTAPVLTVTPSINHPGVFHGFLRNGIITEDCEGRTFPNLPRTA